MTKQIRWSVRQGKTVKLACRARFRKSRSPRSEWGFGFHRNTWRTHIQYNLRLLWWSFIVEVPR